MFDGRCRVWLVAVWNAAATAGLCLGPVYGAYILAAFGGSQGWRWVFRISAAVAAGCFLCLLCVRESRPSRIMKRKLAALARTQQSKQLGSLDWFNPDHAPDASALVRLVIIQPVRLLGTEPIVIMVTMISAVSWGIIYLFTESLPGVYLSMSGAGFTRTTSSLAFLAFLPGVGLSFLPRLWDQSVVRKGLGRGEGIQP